MDSRNRSWVRFVLMVIAAAFALLMASIIAFSYEVARAEELEYD